MSIFRMRSNSGGATTPVPRSTTGRPDEHVRPQVRPSSHHKRESIDTHLTIVFMLAESSPSDRPDGVLPVFEALIAFVRLDFRCPVSPTRTCPPTVEHGRQKLREDRSLGR
ncbi:hypothetical protein GCM10027161_69160 [Microbispora hainanensis]